MSIVVKPTDPALIVGSAWQEKPHLRIPGFDRTAVITGIHYAGTSAEYVEFTRVLTGSGIGTPEYAVYRWLTRMFMDDYEQIDPNY